MKRKVLGKVYPHTGTQDPELELHFDDPRFKRVVWEDAQIALAGVYHATSRPPIVAKLGYSEGTEQL